MNMNRKIAAFLATLLLSALFASCQAPSESGTQDSLDTTETNGEIDTSPVEIGDGTDYAKVLDDGFFELAANVESDFEVETTANGVKVLSYIGTATRCKIPDTIGGVSVTAIAENAFANNTKLEAIAIPQSVKELGSGILKGCTSLRVLYTPLISQNAESTQFLGYLFGAYSYQNNSRDVPASLKLLRLSGMSTLREKALYDCNDLECIILPDTLQKIESFAIYNCTSLLQINGLESVISIGEYALSRCSALCQLRFGERLTSIGFAAMEGCHALQSLTVPFVGGSAKKNTYLAYVFGASAPDFAKGYYPPALVRVEVMEGCASLDNYAFYEFVNLKEIQLPSTIQEIGVRAFYGCDSLWSIDLPTGLENIRESAFFGCTSLLSLTIGEGVTSLGINVFYNCTALRTVKLPTTLQALPASAFAGCGALESIDFGGVREVGNQAFRNCFAISRVTAPSDIHFGEGNDSVIAAMQAKENG